MEGDRLSCRLSRCGSHFNPLPPHGGRLENDIVIVTLDGISIHSLRMEGDQAGRAAAAREGISIHSLRMEGDPLKALLNDSPIFPFQSTPSAWRETAHQFAQKKSKSISIHSLRMEGDQSWFASCSKTRYFNPLPPHGGRRAGTGFPGQQARYFNPLPPHGGRLVRPLYCVRMV